MRRSSWRRRSEVRARRDARLFLILGPWPGIEGLWVATAHFRNGILLAPITARLMTEWITEGNPGMDVKDFLPDRFGAG